LQDVQAFGLPVLTSHEHQPFEEVHVLLDALEQGGDAPL
jgi:hypothetical protein